MKPGVFLLTCAGLLAQTLDRETSFLVKLSDPIGSRASKPGARVGAVIISPERFLGGRFDGPVKAASADSRGGRVEVEFHSLAFKGKTWCVRTTTLEFVNSIGHASVDEQERPVKIEKGVLVSSHPDMLIDEGAELKLSVTPAFPPRPHARGTGHPFSGERRCGLLGRRAEVIDRARTSPGRVSARPCGGGFGAGHCVPLCDIANWLPASRIN